MHLGPTSPSSSAAPIHTGSDPYKNLPRSSELGKLVKQFASEFQNSPNWQSFLRDRQGRSCLASTVGTIPHPAGRLLEHLRSVGAPVHLNSPPWDTETTYAAAARGSHSSADEYLNFVEDDMATMVQKGFWVVLPWELAKDLPDLRLSPLGVVPQRERRPRIIVDYTFSGLNEETLKRAPPEAMQFGRALDRILLSVLEAPDEHGPVYLLKIDLSDGFYRVPMRIRDVPKLGVIFPTAPSEEPLVALPLTLPMGWTESPPWFCTTTETITDLANAYCGSTWDPPLHRLETAAAQTGEPPTDRHWISPPAPTTGIRYRYRSSEELRLPRRRRRPPRSRGPATHVDVFVDDEVMVAQGTAARLNRLRRQLLHVNDLVFRPNDERDTNLRQEPISGKKLAKGDGGWSTTKQVLGWVIDTLRGTIELPPHRQRRLQTILDETKSKRSISQREAHRLLGEIRSMLLALPGGGGLLSQLQHALKTALAAPRPHQRVRLSRASRDCLRDLHLLARDVASRPTRIAELFPRWPAHIQGACDASKAGFGGVVLPYGAQPPIAWRLPLPIDLQDEVVSDDNPEGVVTNSDLELAGTILQEGVIAAQTPVAELTISTGCDNTAAVAWRHKGSNSLSGPSAYLLREAALFQRHQRHIPRLHYLPGDWNDAADAASRRFDLNDSSLLALLNSIAPQTASWQLRHPPPELSSRLISALRQERPAKPSLVIGPKPPRRFGETVGSHTWLTSASGTHSSPVSLTKSRFYGCLPTGGHPVKAAHVRDEVLHVAKVFTDLGHPDPRLTSNGTLDPRLTRQYKAYQNADPAPVRVKPMPIQILHQAELQLHRANPRDSAALDMIWIALFYLLRPGEYCQSRDNAPLRWADVGLLLGRHKIDTSACDPDLLARASHSSITFDDQKNRERGEVLCHSRSSHPIACPTAALGRRIHHLRLHRAPQTTPLCAYYDGTRWCSLNPSYLTAILRTATRALPQLGFPASAVSARSLRAGGAMALLCGRTDTHVIRLVGRWKSDAMFRYLHAQALPLVRDLARTMLTHGAFALLPGTDLPPPARQLLLQADPHDPEAA